MEMTKRALKTANIVLAQKLERAEDEVKALRKALRDTQLALDVFKGATQELSDERNMLQRVIDKAYDNASEFEEDPEIALRCVLESIAPHVEAGSDETAPMGDREPS